MTYAVTHLLPALIFVSTITLTAVVCWFEAHQARRRRQQQRAVLRYRAQQERERYARAGGRGL